MGGFLVFLFLYDAEMYSNLAEGCGDKLRNSAGQVPNSMPGVYWYT